MCAIAEEKPPANFDVRFRQIFKLDDKRGRINNGSGADHRFFPGAQNAAGDQLQHVFMIVEYYGVPGIVAAGVARRVVE